MLISELSKKTNVPTSTIRYYEKLNLLVPSRRDNGYRHYPNEAVELLGLIVQAKGLGFTLKEITDLSKVLTTENKNAKLRKKLEEKLLSLNDQIKLIRKFQKNIKKLLNTNCPL